MPFYALFVPGHSDSPPSSAEKGAGDEITESSFIFQEMTKVLETMRKFKDKNPRFKNFSNFDEAVRFTIEGNSDDSVSDFDNRPGTPRPPPTPEELPRPFLAPTRPELTDLKKAIESKNIEKVRQLIEANPRYLINASGDTPTILQEGFRYNALHVAARVGHLETFKAILPLFRDESSEYVRRLYPDDKDDETTGDRRRQLLDFYLNTPDKGFNETPLHFAAKNGFADVVEYLCSFDECQRTLVNKNGQTAVCAAEESDRVSEKVKKEIRRILETGSVGFYVPLYRARDEAYAPILRRPVAGFPDITLESDQDAFKMGDYRLAAFIGPVDSNVADQLYAQWSSKECSPRGQNSKSKSAKKSGSKTKSMKKKSASKMEMDAVAVKRSDLHKGMERIGRQIAATGKYGWSEYWNFLRVSVDLRSEKGLRQLENYFRQKPIKEGERFEKDLRGKVRQMAENQKRQEKDSCRQKLDFGDSNENNQDGDSSRDSSDLYFDANENEESSGAGDQSSRPSNFERLWEKAESDTGDGYFTPPQELTACVIFGKEPTKLDLDVFATLEDVKIDETHFPQTAAWIKMIRDYSDEERRQWLPLDSPRSARIRQKMPGLRTSE